MGQIKLVVFGLFFLSTIAKAKNEMDLSLEELLDIAVVTATGDELAINRAPAVISVITSQDLKKWKVKSIAEALGFVPGVYCIQEYLSYNCGIRGLNGGFRGQSKIMKVMINNQSVAFRSDTNNYLGTELIPISIVERIEVVRGPASALYGADAFLGVINIITKKESDSTNFEHSIRSEQSKGKPGFIANTSVFGGSFPYKYSVSYSQSYFDRSNLETPKTFPSLSSTMENQKSKKDNEITRVVYGDFSRLDDNIFSNSDTLTTRIDGYFSRIDSDAQWQDYGFTQQSDQLGTGQHISLRNQYMRLTANYKNPDLFSVYGSIAQSQGAPTSDENLDVGAPSFIPKRIFGFLGLDKVLEIRKQIENHTIVLGFDSKKDIENLIEIRRIDRESKQETVVSESKGEKKFLDEGVYIQYRISSDSTDLTLNGRVDRHNIYGENKTYRIAVTHVLSENFNLKLLRGTSFKAPAAMQLFAQPIFSGEVEGNEDLKSEKARTDEAQVKWTINRESEFSLNIFQTMVDDKIEVLRTSVFNVGRQSTKGIELEGIHSSNGFLIKGNISWQQTTAETRNFIGEIEEFPSPSYPMLVTNVYGNWKASPDSNLFGTIRYVSERRATQINILQNGKIPYQLESYKIVDLGIDYSLYGGTLFLKVENVFNEEYGDPGYNGIDVPGKPTAYSLGLLYSH